MRETIFVFGNDGTDWVEGGAGNDNVGGGGGQDSFVFREAGGTNADVFNDFSSGWDNIQLDAAFFITLGAAGQFTSGDARFWSSTSGTAHDADDRIIYNTYDAPALVRRQRQWFGGGMLIGTLNTGATVTADRHPGVRYTIRRLRPDAERHRRQRHAGRREG